MGLAFVFCCIIYKTDNIILCSFKCGDVCVRVCVSASYYRDLYKIFCEREVNNTVAELANKKPFVQVICLSLNLQ